MYSIGIIELVKTAIEIETKLYFLNNQYQGDFNLNRKIYDYDSFFNYLEQASEEELTKFNISFYSYVAENYGSIFPLWLAQNDNNVNHLCQSCGYFVAHLAIAQEEHLKKALMFPPVAQYRDAADFMLYAPTSAFQQNKLTSAIFEHLRNNPSADYDPDWLSDAFQNFMTNNNTYTDEDSDEDIDTDDIYEEDEYLAKINKSLEELDLKELQEELEKYVLNNHITTSEELEYEIIRNLKIIAAINIAKDDYYDQYNDDKLREDYYNDKLDNADKNLAEALEYIIGYISDHTAKQAYKTIKGIIDQVIVEDSSLSANNNNVALDEKIWRTLHPNGDDSEGRPVLIDTVKKIVIKGLGRNNGIPLSELLKNKKARTQTKSKPQAEVTGPNKEQANSSPIKHHSKQGKPSIEQLVENYYEEFGSEPIGIRVRQPLQTIASSHPLAKTFNQYLDRRQPLVAKFSTKGVTTTSTLSSVQAPDKKKAPLNYAFWQRQQQENGALVLPNWEPPVECDFGDYAVCYAIIARGAYGFQAMKRIALGRGQPLTDEQIELGEKFESEYQFLLNYISDFRAKNFAKNLVTLGSQIGETALSQVKHREMPIIRQFLMNTRLVDNPPSLLNLIGTSGNTNNKFYKELDNPFLYVKLPSTITELEQSTGLSDNPAYNNLFNAVALLVAVNRYTPNATKLMRSKTDALYNQALKLYRESHDCLPLSICLNLDMAAIIQKQSKYGAPFYDHKLIAGVPQRKPHSYQEARNFTNPHFDSDIIPAGYKHKPFKHNCQGCVVALELALRGYEVSSRPNMKNDHNNLYDLSLHPNLIWRNPITGSAPIMRPVSDFEQLAKLCYFGERYNVIINVEVQDQITGKTATSSHVVEVERDGDKVMLCDPQIGFYGSIKQYQEHVFTDKSTLFIKPISLYRIDNCEIFGDYANRVVREPTPVPVFDAKVKHNV